MKASSADMLGLVGTVNVKMARVVGDLMAKRGRTGATKEIEECMKTARRLWHRFKLYQDEDGAWHSAKGADPRHTDLEEGQVIRLGQWLVEQHQAMHNQPQKPFEVSREHLVKKNA